MVSVPVTNLHCASRRRARSLYGNTAACTCPRPSPRYSEQHWLIASALSVPVPPFASETVSHWKSGSSGQGWGPLVGEGGRRNKKKNGENKRIRARKRRRIKEKSEGRKNMKRNKGKINRFKESMR